MARLDDTLRSLPDVSNKSELAAMWALLNPHIKDKTVSDEFLDKLVSQISNDKCDKRYVEAALRWLRQKLVNLKKGDRIALIFIFGMLVFAYLYIVDSLFPAWWK